MRYVLLIMLMILLVHPNPDALWDEVEKTTAIV